MLYISRCRKLYENYHGLSWPFLITDDLSDASLNKVCTQAEAAVAAVKAGMSMLYVSTGFESSYNAVLSAVNSGEIPAEKLDDAVGRILTTKGI